MLGGDRARDTTVVLFEAVGEKERLVAVESEGVSLLFRVVGRPGRVVIKCDKTTRIPDTNLIKRTLARLMTLYQGKVLHTNIAMRREDLADPNLVAPPFFSGDLDGYTRLWIEVGFGSGRHLLYQAKNNPDVLIVGIEIHKPSTEQVLRRCAAEGVANVRVLDFDARLLLQILDADSVERIFVHFPIPWDKAPQRRVISRHFIDEAIRALVPGGTLELRTDDRGYFDYSVDLLTALTKADIAIRKNGDLPVVSKYEDRWRRQSKDIYDVVFRNDESSPRRAVRYDFGFGPVRPFAAVAAGLRHEPMVDHAEGFVVHFLRPYAIGETGGMIETVMGAFDRPERKFLLFRDGTVTYYPNAPLGVRENYLAHEAIKRVLHGE